MRHILGISAFYHDSAAALLRDGQIVAAAQEERFTRRKNDERFPKHAVDFCLKFAGIPERELDAIVFYDKPITKFTRLLETYLAVAPHGLITFPRVLPSWLAEKLNLRKTIRDELPGLRKECKVLFTEHHQSHAASAFYPSPFKEAAILTVDGVGEWATTTVGRGHGNELEILKELRFPHSLGLLYSAFTAYCGFRINSGEYKLMGLAPYGQPKYAAAIYDNLIDLKPDGSFWLNMDYFAFLRSLVMTNHRFHALFDGPPRRPESPIDNRHKDVAASIQAVTNEVMLRLARHAREMTGLRHLCMAGGVALNCVANGLILREKIFDDVWIQPAAGDAGGALGAALAVAQARCDMQASLLGPEFSNAEIEFTLRSHFAVYEQLNDAELFQRTAGLIAAEKVVGWVQGRMEFGPRALGNRSILGDPRSPKMQAQMNLKIKFRESFRPFAPVVRAERVSDYFEFDRESPYMLLVAPVRKSGLPAVTHVDNSARIQTLKREDNPRFYALLQAFEKLTGCPVLINTSFNIRGEPIVCTPDDAYRCLVNTEMDYLVIGNFLLERLKQPHKQIARTFDLLPD
jgi:carbamoyltransferase